MKYRYQAVKTAVILICVLAACICCSCDGRQGGWESGELSVLSGPGDTEMSRGEEMPEEKTGRMIKDPVRHQRRQKYYRLRFLKVQRQRSATYISVGKSFCRASMRWKREAEFSRLWSGPADLPNARHSSI